MNLAITGATGFVGSHLLDAALASGRQVRALTRRPQSPRAGVTWILGSLSDSASLGELVRGADATIHVAGVINASDRAGFDQGNVEGTRNVLAAASSAGVRDFIHVSSLAAREPDLSLYGASKAAAERLVEGSDLDWSIVRPPAVYGPGDRETLELFRMAKRRLLLLPPRGRLSLIHVHDLVRLLLSLADQNQPVGAVFEPDDGRAGGWTHEEFGRMLGEAVGRRGVRVSLPSQLVSLGARADRLLRGSKAKLTPDRAAYFCHPDWVAAADKHPPATLWSPHIPAQPGLADTAKWYRDHGWL